SSANQSMRTGNLRFGRKGYTNYAPVHSSVPRASPGNSSTLPCIYALHFRCDASSDNENIAVAARSQLGMSKAQHVWALILAGGDGSRLRALTTKPCGTAVPKQFCRSEERRVGKRGPSSEAQRAER